MLKQAFAVAIAALVVAACAPAQPSPTSPAAKPAPTTVPAKPAPKAEAKDAASPAAKAEAKPGPSPEVGRLIAAARAAGENELTLAWSTGGDADWAKDFASIFSRMYGLDIKILWQPGNLDTVTGNVIQQQAAGQPAQTDVLFGTDTHVGPLVGRGVLEEYNYSQLSPRIRQDMLAPNGIAVEIGSAVSGVTYNTNAVSQAEVPRKLEDVLDPRWKGRIASTTTAAVLDRVSLSPGWNADRVKSFVTRLANQIGGLIRIPEQTRIATGEFIMLVINNGSQDVRRQKAQGAPMGHAAMSDLALVSYYYLAVPRNSAHPNLAKLFVNMVTSEEGQQSLVKTTYLSHHLLPGSPIAEEVNAIRAAGLEPVKADAAFVAGHPELQELRGELTRILTEKRGG